MSKILTLVLILSTGVCVQIHAQSAEEKQAVYEMFEAQGMRTQMDKIAAVMIQTMLKEAPQMQAYRYDLMQFYLKNIGYDAVKEDLARIYLKYFTIPEIREITKFYRSPVGKKMRERSADILMEANAFTTMKMQKAIPEFLKEMQKKGKLK